MVLISFLAHNVQFMRKSVFKNFWKQWQRGVLPYQSAALSCAFSLYLSLSFIASSRSSKQYPVPGSSSLQTNSCTATHCPFRKPSKFEELLVWVEKLGGTHERLPFMDSYIQTHHYWTTKIYTKQHITFFCSSYLAFSWSASLIQNVQPYSSSNKATASRKSSFILSER